MNLAADPVVDHGSKSSSNLRAFSRLWNRFAFARLMGLYEENYRLCVETLGIEPFDSNEWNLLTDSKLPALVVEVRNRAPYTMTLEMRFEKGGPELLVSCRLYTDLKVCDAIFFMDRKEPGDSATVRLRGLEQQWASSLRFQKWLYYLKDQGYARKRPLSRG